LLPLAAPLLGPRELVGLADSACPLVRQVDVDQGPAPAVAGPADLPVAIEVAVVDADPVTHDASRMYVCRASASVMPRDRATSYRRRSRSSRAENRDSSVSIRARSSSWTRSSVSTSLDTAARWRSSAVTGVCRYDARPA